MPAIPIAAPGLRFARYRSEIDTAVAGVLERGKFILGPEVASFEAEFAGYLGLPYVVALASGTDALTLSLASLGIGPGDEVLVPALSAPATAAAVLRAGATLRFVDVDPSSRAIDVSRAAASASDKTRAMVVVHLHGAPAPMGELAAAARRLGLAIVEDCAQAHGTRCDGRLAGTFGEIAAFSFYPTKNLSAFGDAGCIATRSSVLADRVRRLREYGRGANNLCQEAGTNSRLDEVHAAVLRVMLKHLDEGNGERRAFARFYDDLLSEGRFSGLINKPGTFPGSTFHQYAITVDARERLAKALAECGVETAVHYQPPLPRHPHFARCSANASLSFPVAEHLANTLLSLPIQPELRQFDNDIATALRSCAGQIQAYKRA